MIWRWHAWRRQADCLHHNRATGISWVIDDTYVTGIEGALWCHMCNKLWRP